MSSPDGGTSVFFGVLASSVSLGFTVALGQVVRLCRKHHHLFQLCRRFENAGTVSLTAVKFRRCRAHLRWLFGIVSFFVVLLWL